MKKRQKRNTLKLREVCLDEWLFFSFKDAHVLLSSSIYNLLKRQVLVDQRLSRGFSGLPEGELGAKGRVQQGRREARPWGWVTQEEGAPFHGLRVPWSVVPQWSNDKSPFLHSRVSSCCCKTYLRYTGATKRLDCSSPRPIDSSICSPTPPITTADRCCLPRGTQTAPISDGNLITVATVRAVDSGQEPLLL